MSSDARGSATPLGVVLTAGLGTRLRPLTPETPKSLIPILNRPLIAYALQLMQQLGVDETVVVTGPGDDATARATREAAPPGLRVSFAVQTEARGPGDAVASVGAALHGRTVAVLAVDTVLVGLERSPLAEFVQSGAAAGLLLKPVADPRSFGVAVLEGQRVVDLEEKPAQPRSNLALVGLWLLSPQAIERVVRDPVINAKGESDLTATVATFVGEADVLGWTFEGEWLDGGTLEGVLQAQAALLPRLPADERAVPTSASVDGSTLSGVTLIGAGASVQRSALTDCVVGAGAQLRDARLTRCMVVPGARCEGVDYSDVVVTRDGTAVGPGATASALGR